MELIDKQKLYGVVLARCHEYIEQSNIHDAAILGSVLTDIESGTFDDQSTQEEIAKLKEDKAALWQTIEQYKEMHEMRRLVHQELLEGLKWYADRDNWDAVKILDNNAYSDSGEHARSIIAKIESTKAEQGLKGDH